MFLYFISPINKIIKDENNVSNSVLNKNTTLKLSENKYIITLDIKNINETTRAITLIFLNILPSIIKLYF